MARIKNQANIERRRLQKRDSERKRREKIKKDPVLYEHAKNKERERYHKRKSQGKINLINDLSERSQRKQRKVWKEGKAKQRRSIKENSRMLRFLEDCTPPSSEHGDYVVDGNPVLNVATSSTSRHKCGRKQVKRNRSVTYRNLKKTEKDLAKWKKKYEKYRVKYYRLKKQKCTNSNSPRSKVDRLLNGERVSPSVRRQLVFNEALKEQLNLNVKSTKEIKHKKQILMSITGPVMKKYRFANELKKTIGVCGINRFVKKKKQPASSGSYWQTVKKQVVLFLEQDESSRVCPGKKDTITNKKIKKQKRYLNDTLHNLYKKFCKENKDHKISYAAFCKIRPFWILIPNAALRETCLCTIHENVRLLFLKVKILGLTDYKDPDDFCKSICCGLTLEESCLERICDQCKFRKPTYKDYNPEERTSHKKWRTIRTTVNIKGQDKICQKNVKEEITCTKSDLVDALNANLEKYMSHVANIKHQYSSLNTIKANLKTNEVLIHMDFSENYNCKYFREVQSAHFGASKPQITLHTVVWYHRSEENAEVTPNSFCSLSNNLRHDPIAILAHLEPLFGKIKSILPNLSTVHFLSDGPTTQYRNKTMFQIFGGLFPQLLNVKKMSWNFLESGHGKGAPDGIGGCLKRTADRIVAQGTDIPNFETLTSELRRNCPGIFIESITEDNISKHEDKINKNISTFSGTMKVHQLVWTENERNTIFARRLSCTDYNCVTVCEQYHLGAIEVKLNNKLQYKDVYSDDADSDTELTNSPKRLPNIFEEECYIVAEWPENSSVFYIGQIKEILENEQYVVSFMHRISSKNHKYLFIWPEVEDKDQITQNMMKQSLHEPSELRRNKFLFENNELSQYANLK